MTTVSLPAPNIVSPARLFDLTNKLTIGSAVGFTEGIVASIMVLVPQNHWFYIALTVLTLAIWAAFWRFRANKLGADVGDLIFLELVVHVGATMLYFAGGMTPAIGLVYWYIYTCISALKILRVYIWQTSATQRHGWGRFGFMTNHHARNHAATDNIISRSRVWGELVLLLGVSILFSAGFHLLSDAGRLVVSWVVPLTFEFLNGPVQLRGMAVVQTLLAGSSQRAAEDAEEIARLTQALADKEAQQRAVDAEKEAMRKTIDALREQHNLPNEEVATLIASYMAIHEVKRAHLVEMAVAMTELYPATPKAKT